MSDIQKIRETRTKDDGDWEEWPYPTVEIESVITGDLRAAILRKLGFGYDGHEVRLIETDVSSGYSEFTQEDDCSIAVTVDGAEKWKAESLLSTDSAMARFLKEFG